MALRPQTATSSRPTSNPIAYTERSGVQRSVQLDGVPAPDEFSGLGATVTVDLSAKTTELVTDTRRQLLEGIDTLSTQLAASVRVASLALVIAAVVGGAALILRRK